MARNREQQREYDRKRDPARKAQLAKESYHRHLERSRARNRAVYARTRDHRLAQQAKYRAKPEVRAQKLEYFRTHRNLKVYGVANPVEGMKSLDGKHVYGNYGRKFTCPAEPKPIPISPARARKPDSSTTHPAKKQSSQASQSDTYLKPKQPPSSPASPTPSKPWSPKPVNTSIPAPTKVTSWLCTCNQAFSSKKAAKQHEDTHAVAPPLATIQWRPDW